MQVANRRYRVIDGRLEKAWHGSNEDGWRASKQAAWEAVHAAPGIDWSAKWLTVRASLRAHGFDGNTKAEALAFAQEKGWKVPV